MDLIRRLESCSHYFTNHWSCFFFRRFLASVPSPPGVIHQNVYNEFRNHFSSLHNALYIYLWRLCRPIIKTKIVNEYSVGGKKYVSVENRQISCSDPANRFFTSNSPVSLENAPII